MRHEKTVRMTCNGDDLPPDYDSIEVHDNATYERGRLVSDAERLAGYVEVWKGAVDDFVALLDEVPDDGGTTPTDLPGWDVKALAAQPPTSRACWPATRRRPPRSASRARHGAHGALHRDRRREPARPQRARHRGRAPRGHRSPRRPAARRSAHRRAGQAGGDLRRRAVVVGEAAAQSAARRLDARAGRAPRAAPTRRPREPAAQHSTDYLLEGFGDVLAKKAGAPAGTTAVVRVDGSEPYAFAVNDAGRGERLPEPPDEPTVELSTDRETYIVMAGGRRAAEPGAVHLQGDITLGERLLAAIATTP